MVLSFSNKQPPVIVISMSPEWMGAWWPSGRALDSRARCRSFDTYLHHIVSLSKDINSPESTANTQEAMALSRLD